MLMANKKRKRHPPGSLPRRLYDLRLALRLTQGEAARRVRVSRRTWNSWESGTQTPSPPHQLLIDLLEQGKI